ncbi:VPLPA-CTERM-specific exosortase XrtD [Candidatus Nitrospira inopinata]|jgi:exosortase D (VPLPA-CTERM-specific)|uniref:Putative EpsI family protein n=1 Tax=Candidatus Nitrospira inopinata TaxID=1715989 RepID=A0A0S4KQ30_9BACT|nr:VPLPA-CTERM-specific exosortase XrtD [Candidatus Nitrospira inopinata]CUQ65408.1 putative EpsI family protein [Candidatus Nitrospira inopinata]
MVIVYLLSLMLPLAAVWIGYPAGIDWLLKQWNSEEYSHAIMIPLVGAYMVLLGRPTEGQPVRGSRMGAALLLVSGVATLLLAHYGHMFSVYGFSLLLMTCGVFVLSAGWEQAKRHWAALVLLLFAIPMPTALFNKMSSSLQLISSRLGAAMIELAGITVHLEGNVIDIGTMQMQVVEACSGLRYLLPLVALAYIVGVFSKAGLVRIGLLLVAAAPITVLMNSIRIALTAVFSEYLGVNTAEGFLHDFEGWVIFFPALGLILAVNVVLSKLADRNTPAFDWALLPEGGLGSSLAAQARTFTRGGLPALATTVVLMAGVASLPFVLPQRTVVTPPREQFSMFPLELKGWKGQHERMDVIYRNALPWSDYLLANFMKPGGPVINVFVPYFPSLYEDSYSHNPAVCLPGNGWSIEEQGVKELSNRQGPDHQPLRINRLVATIEGKRHVVYYWFQHRGMVIADQNAVKPILLWNSLTQGRIDGALVRLVMPLDAVSDVSAADAAMEDMATAILDTLPRFVPS